MKKLLLIISIWLIYGYPFLSFSQNLVNVNATEETRALKAFLDDTYGKRMISGQYWDTWAQYVKDLTGETPAILGLDFMDYTPTRLQNGARPTDTQKAIDWVNNKGGIVTFSWHWDAPADIYDVDYRAECAGTTGGDARWWKAFYSCATYFNVATAVDNPGSANYNLIIRDIDLIAEELKILQAAKVPVLWRPLHEAAGRWFWWGAQGPTACKKLWNLMYTRLTDHHKLNNLIWVWNCYADQYGNPNDWIPPSNQVDIIAYDYPRSTSWAEYTRLHGNKGKLFALAETGGLPNPDNFPAQGWSYFVTWSDFIRNSNTEATVRRVFNHPNVMNLEDLPNLKNYLPGKDNLALNKAVTVTSTEVGANIASNLTDGRTNTRWSSLYADPQTVSIDLTQVYTLNKIVLRWEAASARNYRVEVSTDGLSWTSVYQTTTGNGGIQIIDNLANAGRYIRLIGTTRNSQWGYSLYEIEAYGDLPSCSAIISTTTPITFCQGGSVVLTASAGSSYIWRNGNTTLSTTTQTHTANAAGNYTVEVTNANGCKATSASTTVTVNPMPTATISTTTPTTFCQGGSVVLTASAGTSYIWRNGNTTLSTTTQTLTATGAGSYSVEVTNANGCKATSAATTVTVNPLPTATVSTTTFCQGGSVVLTASAGTSYIWRNGNTTLTTTTQTHTANAAGTYTVEVTNANGCKATSSATTVTVNPLPTATISTTTPTTFCQGGSVVLTASAGSSYVWRNGNTILTTTAQTHTANAAGTYTVEVTNANGCKATSTATTVTVNPLPTATISTTTPTTFCQGGSVVLTASAGSSYIWRNGSTVLTTTTQTHTANAAGTYTVEVTNANGCKATSTATPVEVQIPTTWYADLDNDGWGDINTTKVECTQPVGYVSISGDNCPSISNPSQTNTDGDAQGDACDTDDDNDGIDDANDCAPLDKNIGVAITWYADADNDGWGDINTTKVECTQPVGYVAISGDNCPSTSNPSQTNTDGDAQGDACDTDDDNDGIADANDCAPLDKNIGVATTWYADLDNDGLGDINTTKVECTQPVGYVSTTGDNCPNDLNKTNPGNCGCGNTENSCLDCFGTPNGTAFLDECKICVGGLTQKEACIKDCHGDFGGTAIVDSCGKCAGGNTGLAAITLKDRCITSVEEINSTITEVQPNPFSDYLQVKVTPGMKYRINDMYGKVVIDYTTSEFVNTSGLSSGTYILEFENASNSIKHKKLIKY